MHFFLKVAHKVLIGVVSLKSDVKDLEKPAISCSISVRLAFFQR